MARYPGPIYSSASGRALWAPVVLAIGLMMRSATERHSEAVGAANELLADGDRQGGAVRGRILTAIEGPQHAQQEGKSFN